MSLRFFFLSIVFILLSFGNCLAQRTPSLDRFEVIRINDFVKIDLILSQGAFCDGIKYYRSNDGINFNFIGQVNGICGSDDQPEQFEFTDNSPVWNASNYYKVEFGGYGFSEPIKIDFFELDKNGSRAFPNPAREEVRIFFDNLNQKPFNIRLFGQNGQTILSNQTFTDHFTIDLTNIHPGIYFYKINKSEEKHPGIMGRLIVQ